MPVILRSLHFKLLAAAVALITLLLLLILMLQWQRNHDQAYQTTEQELQENLARLFSSSRTVPTKKPKQPLAFEDLKLAALDEDVDVVICQDDGHTLWHYLRQPQFQHATQDFCVDFARQRKLVTNDFAFRLDDRDPQAPFFIYDLRLERYIGKPITFMIVLLSPAKPLLDKLARQDKRSLRDIVLIWLSGILLLVLGTRWGLSSLRRIQQQIEQIQEGRRQELELDVEAELRPLTRSLNQLLENERKQKLRYQNTLNDLAHSLKTRLALIEATFDEAKVTPKLREQTTQQVKQMDQMIQYHLRRAVAGRQALNNQGIDPIPLLQKLQATMSKVYRHKQVQIELTFEDGLQFAGEADDLFELMGNLLDNACKFAISQVVVRLRRVANQLIIQVEDDGPGIGEALRARVTQRGVRADNSGGQGIGLSVCAEIIDSYGGQLLIGDSPLGGASIQLNLPCLEPNNKNAVR
ncbi:ATP-binding protein [Pseudaeromonas paramecii]|uniref:histidine kinase n=1 Tax=Pseudaeromonas paramecii TaxID=2138166 RepID=A0ABP8Q340_9GAMM